jgi:hypothetical protein
MVLTGAVWPGLDALERITEAQVAGFNRTRAFGGAFVLALVMAANLAMFLADAKTTWLWGLTAGLLAGVGWVATGIGVIGLFENRSAAYILINAGYQVVALAVMGAILGAWR